MRDRERDRDTYREREREESGRVSAIKSPWKNSVDTQLARGNCAT